MLANVDHALGHEVLHVDAVPEYALDYDLNNARYVAVVHTENDLIVASI